MCQIFFSFLSVHFNFTMTAYTLHTTVYFMDLQIQSYAHYIFYNSYPLLLHVLDNTNILKYTHISIAIQ